MDLAELPSEDISGDAPRFPARVSRRALDAPTRRQGVGFAGGDLGDLAQAGRAGGRLARLRSRRRRASRDPGGDGRARPRRLPGADVVGRARQSRALGCAGRCSRSTCWKNCMPARRASPFSFGALDPDRNAGAVRIDGRPSERACFALSRSPGAARICSWRSIQAALALVELDEPGVEIEPTRAMGAWGLYEVRLNAAPATLVPLAIASRSTICCSRRKLALTARALWRGPARLRAGGRLCQGAPAVRAADRQIPGDPAQARELPDRARRRAADARSCGASA